MSRVVQMSEQLCDSRPPFGIADDQRRVVPRCDQNSALINVPRIARTERRRPIALITRIPPRATIDDAQRRSGRPSSITDARQRGAEVDDRGSRAQVLPPASGLAARGPARANGARQRASPRIRTLRVPQERAQAGQGRTNQFPARVRMPASQPGAPGEMAPRLSIKTRNLSLFDRIALLINDAVRRGLLDRRGAWASNP
jgi:hypothetical protein